MIAKPYQICIKGNVLTLLKSYLTDRKQIVVVDVKKSNDTDIKAGIPQGSKLGPSLFIIYINNITEIGLESDIFIFADDCSLLVSGKTPENTIAILKRDLEKYLNGLPNGKLLSVLLKQKIFYSKESFKRFSTSPI